jgi:hypothetical protein
VAGNQVTLGTVDGAKSLDNLGPADTPARLCHLLAQPARQGLDLVEGGGPVAKHGFQQLPGPVGGLPEIDHQIRKLLTGKAKKIFDSSRGYTV